MPRHKSFPEFRRKIVGRREYAVVTLSDHVTGRRRDIVCGAWGTDEARQRYLRVLAAWDASGRRLPEAQPDPTRMAISTLTRRYREFAAGEYSTTEQIVLARVLDVLDEYAGDMDAMAFGPRALRLWRETLVAGLYAPDGTELRPPWARTRINRDVFRIKRMFKWAASEELLPPQIYEALRTVDSLKKGRTRAIEHPRVTPVPAAIVEATAACASAIVGAMIRLQALTGMRPGELCDLRPGLVDRSGPIWVYEPAAHKTTHLDRRRRIFIGPRGQEILRPFLERRPEEHCFSPAAAARELLDQRRQDRVTPEGRGNGPGTNVRKRPRCRPGNHYAVTAYNRAIARACDRADAEARLAIAAAGATPADGVRAIPRWHAHQLRHSFATEVRRCAGLEASAVLLGHSSAAITDAIYAERDELLARQAIERVG